LRCFVFPAEEPEPRCPIAVLRVGDDGTEQVFTRELRWEPSSGRLEETPGRDPWEVDQDWAEMFVIDMIVAMRRVRYGDSDPSIREYYNADGVWGQRRTQPDIDLGHGEAVLVERAPAPFRWLVSKWGAPRQIVLRIADDGTVEQYTDDLRWKSSKRPGAAQDLEEVDERTALWRVAGVIERVRGEWSHRWPGAYHFAIFNQGRQALDLDNALHVVRAKGGHDSYLGDSFAIGRDWHPATTLRDFSMGNERGVKIPIAKSEADHLVEVILRRREQWSRAYWVLGN
jgi:hypothetical protein